MISFFTAFSVALGAVVLAEMGDKTQLLAMCFATRFNWKKVMLGVFLATVLNHALAVAAGYFLRTVLSAYTTQIQLVAALSFIGFALWTVRGDEVDDACDTKMVFGPVITVALAFFLAEMGDKTQFTTVSLAASFNNPVAVLAGTTTGMLVADGIGIIAGVVLNKRIPESLMKWISAGIFAVCGMVGYVEAATKMMGTTTLIVSTLLITGGSAAAAYAITRAGKKSKALGETAVAVESDTIHN